MTEHVGYDPYDPAGHHSGNSRGVVEVLPAVGLLPEEGPGSGAGSRSLAPLLGPAGRYRTGAGVGSGRRKAQRELVRDRVGVTLDHTTGPGGAAEAIREAAEVKNHPPDLINVALELLVKASLELPGFSTLDEMASQIRSEVNTAIFERVVGRIPPADAAHLEGLLKVAGPARKSGFDGLKQTAGRSSWSAFRAQVKHLGWVDALGDTGVWLEGVAESKVADFAGEAALLPFYAGTRIAEVVALDVDDVGLSARKGVLRIYGKGERVREVPIHPQLRRSLAGWLDERPDWPGAHDNPALFLNQQSGRLGVRGAHRVITGIAAAAGLDDDTTAHVLRHSFATTLVRGGTDVVIVAELLGHVRLETTRNYTRPTAEDRTRAVNLLPVDQ